MTTAVKIPLLYVVLCHTESMANTEQYSASESHHIISNTDVWEMDVLEILKMTQLREQLREHLIILDGTEKQIKILSFPYRHNHILFNFCSLKNNNRQVLNTNGTLTSLYLCF